MSTDDTPPEPDRRGALPHPREALTLHGQDAAEAAFLEAWGAGRLHHAWLLRGPEGVGKATFAYRMARALVAAGDGAPPPDLAPPADCPVMRRIRAGAEPRLVVLRRGLNERTKRLRTQIGVDDVRALRPFLALSAPDGGWRVVIVDAADEMTVQAANALLKSLEEPPARTAFILVTHAPGRLLPTIRSRTRALDLSPLAPDAMAAALDGLGERPSAEEAAGLAALASGSVGVAMTLSAEGGLALYHDLCGLLAPGGRPAFRIDRVALVRFAEGMGGKAGEGRYALALTLGPTLLARLARAAAGAMPPPALPAEARLLDHASREPGLAAALAEASATMAAAGSRAKAVSLDPGRTVIDTWLGLEAALERPLQRA
ncbi:MAG: DNA polymerase III subunit delta' [Pseudomonadota bacterium]